MLDKPQIPNSKSEPGVEWLERLQWLGIRVEEPGKKGQDQAAM
ncbi:hypothetical protein [Moorella sp. Hama-1]|nr:hypothetical protein [Moorella sp. Hama-1]MDN5361169.1 hypothetical protein [Moorella sp. (in: firmicutes)]BCV20863.1 hypothetical protein hamaS1_09320 [Moorella sp. Hama-1]